MQPSTNNNSELSIVNYPLSILYEDNHLIAINKTCRDIVQGDKTGDMPLSEKLKAWLKVKYNKPGNVFVGWERYGKPTGQLSRTSRLQMRENWSIGWCATRSRTKVMLTTRNARTAKKPFSITVSSPALKIIIYWKLT